MENAETSLRLENLSTGYREKGRQKVVSRGLNAELHAGKLTCLLGENGCGKSTLLRTLAGFVPPIEGEIRLQGKPLADFAPSDLAQKIGVVLTERPDVQHLTVADLVSMGRSPYTGFWGTLAKADRRIVDEAMQMVGITPLAARFVNTLSDGERQKMMIAKALAQQTPIIFLDEPTAFLDFPSKVEVMRLLGRMAAEMHKTVLLSTHDLDMALQLADCIWLLRRGGELAIGTPDELAENGTFAHFFCGRGITFDNCTRQFMVERG